MLDVRLAGYATGPPDGMPVVLLHGFPFDRHLWEPQQDVLAQEGYRVVLPDLRGHGHSPSTPEVATMEAMASDVFRLLDRLQASRTVVVGHSMGGYVALAMYAAEPDRFAGLVLANTRAEADDEEGQAKRDEMATAVREGGSDVLVDRMFDKLMSPTTRERQPALVESVVRIMRQTPPEGAVNALMGMRDRPDRRDLLRKIRVPTLVIAGVDDPITPPDDARAMADAIPGARLEVLGGAAHLSMLESPKAFNEALLGFLDGLR